MRKGRIMEENYYQNKYPPLKRKKPSKIDSSPRYQSKALNPRMNKNITITNRRSYNHRRTTNM
jgi:hypothetical protein